MIISFLLWVGGLIIGIIELFSDPIEPTGLCIAIFFMVWAITGQYFYKLNEIKDTGDNIYRLLQEIENEESKNSNEVD